MLKFIITITLLMAAVTASAADWFTIVGDAADPNADTILMDPVARKTDGALRTMGIRVSRSIQRTSAGGEVFRSYEGTVEFDCDKQTARFFRIQFFEEPLWKKPSAVADYPHVERATDGVSAIRTEPAGARHSGGLPSPHEMTSGFRALFR